MADILAGTSYVPRTDAEEPRRARNPQALLVGVIVVLSLILAGELVYHLVLAPRIAIESIEIEGNLPLTEEEIIQIAGVSIGTPYFAVDAEAAAERLRAHPVVRDAQVTVLFPNRVAITATRRQPLAVSLAQTDAGPTLVVFDAEGVVFATGEEAAGTELPVISGLRFAAAEPGIRLPELVVEFLEQLHAIRMTDPELLSLFSEFRVVRKNEYAYEVILYPMYYPVGVRIGTSITPEMIEYVMMMLDVLSREGRLASIAELDFRGGEGVLRPKGETNG
jgi:cell division protein FtsQ